MLERLLAISDQDFFKDHLFKFLIVTIDGKLYSKYKIIVHNPKYTRVEAIQEIQQLFPFKDKAVVLNSW